MNSIGAKPEDLRYCLEPLEAFDGQGFIIPAILHAVGFHPYRVAKRLVKNCWPACFDHH